ncbi:unnamed protein product [Amoebophrya sp. A120]|nr:unnamed protein product [Amoebophrya sp. A120]|eukprot:GSA120T00009594001.1
MPDEEGLWSFRHLEQVQESLEQLRKKREEEWGQHKEQEDDHRVERRFSGSFGALSAGRTTDLPGHGQQITSRTGRHNLHQEDEPAEHNPRLDVRTNSSGFRSTRKSTTATFQDEDSTMSVDDQEQLPRPAPVAARAGIAVAAQQDDGGRSTLNQEEKEKRQNAESKSLTPPPPPSSPDGPSISGTATAAAFGRAAAAIKSISGSHPAGLAEADTPAFELRIDEPVFGKNPASCTDWNTKNAENLDHVSNYPSDEVPAAAFCVRPPPPTPKQPPPPTPKTGKWGAMGGGGMGGGEQVPTSLRRSTEAADFSLFNAHTRSGHHDRSNSVTPGPDEDFAEKEEGVRAAHERHHHRGLDNGGHTKDDEDDPFGSDDEDEEDEIAEWSPATVPEEDDVMGSTVETAASAADPDPPRNGGDNQVPGRGAIVRRTSSFSSETICSDSTREPSVAAGSFSTNPASSAAGSRSDSMERMREEARVGGHHLEGSHYPPLSAGGGATNPGSPKMADPRLMFSSSYYGMMKTSQSFSNKNNDRERELPRGGGTKVKQGSIRSQLDVANATAAARAAAEADAKEQQGSPDEEVGVNFSGPMRPVASTTTTSAEVTPYPPFVRQNGAAGSFAKHHVDAEAASSPVKVKATPRPQPGAQEDVAMPPARRGLTPETSEAPGRFGSPAEDSTGRISSTSTNSNVATTTGGPRDADPTDETAEDPSLKRPAVQEDPSSQQHQLHFFAVPKSAAKPAVAGGLPLAGGLGSSLLAPPRCTSSPSSRPSRTRTGSSSRARPGSSSGSSSSRGGASCDAIPEEGPYEGGQDNYETFPSVPPSGFLEKLYPKWIDAIADEKKEPDEWTKQAFRYLDYHGWPAGSFMATMKISAKMDLKPRDRTTNTGGPESFPSPILVEMKEPVVPQRKMSADGMIRNAKASEIAASYACGRPQDVKGAPAASTGTAAAAGTSRTNIKRDITGSSTAPSSALSSISSKTAAEAALAAFSCCGVREERKDVAMKEGASSVLQQATGVDGSGRVLEVEANYGADLDGLAGALSAMNLDHEEGALVDADEQPGVLTEIQLPPAAVPVGSYTTKNIDIAPDHQQDACMSPTSQQHDLDQQFQAPLDGSRSRCGTDETSTTTETDCDMDCGALSPTVVCHQEEEQQSAELQHYRREFIMRRAFYWLLHWGNTGALLKATPPSDKATGGVGSNPGVELHHKDQQLQQPAQPLLNVKRKRWWKTEIELETAVEGFESDDDETATSAGGKRSAPKQPEKYLLLCYDENPSQCEQEHFGNRNKSAVGGKRQPASPEQGPTPTAYEARMGAGGSSTSTQMKTFLGASGSGEHRFSQQQRSSGPIKAKPGLLRELKHWKLFQGMEDLNARYYLPYPVKNRPSKMAAPQERHPGAGGGLGVEHDASTTSAALQQPASDQELGASAASGSGATAARANKRKAPSAPVTAPPRAVFAQGLSKPVKDKVLVKFLFLGDPDARQKKRLNEDVKWHWANLQDKMKNDKMTASTMAWAGDGKAM